MKPDIHRISIIFKKNILMKYSQYSLVLKLYFPETGVLALPGQRFFPVFRFPFLPYSAVGVRHTWLSDPEFLFLFHSPFSLYRHVIGPDCSRWASWHISIDFSSITSATLSNFTSSLISKALILHSGIHALPEPAAYVPSFVW